MTPDILLSVAALAAIGTGVVLGPLRLTVRAAMRGALSRHATLAFEKPVSAGIALGLCGATLISAVAFSGATAVTTAVLSLLILLATVDLAWRWLPLEWTVPLLVLAGVSAVVTGETLAAILGALVGAGTLLALQITFRIWRGVHALGTGDIWLAAGLGALAGMPAIAWILTLSAVSGLFFAAVKKQMSQENKDEKLGVAYGAHLCGVYVITLVF